ncbi:MAG: glycerol-3-phosphate dehydrogenase/oxidase [Phycisphaerales bacterium]|nr:glycerol-3-phosphate dehydrogenase/oxidase [Phycisphaerales bacterium]
MRRSEMVDRIVDRSGTRDAPWDMVVIGGGATGLGIAVDAAARGYAVALLEQSDFAKGTSSRSTKLVHGGVRYLQQGNVSLVMEALEERGILRGNAPHLVHDLPFVVPSYAWWQSPFYGVGLKVYDMLAGRYGFGRSRHLSREETLARIPNLEDDGLRGGTLYHDGQFDDARLAIALARTAADRGAVVLNHAPVVAIERRGDTVVGVVAHDLEREQELRLQAKVVVNATGPFADAVRRLVDPEAEAMIAPSQGVHLVLDRSFLAGDAAIMVPHTSDGRVMFAIPWHHVVVVGTTDTPVRQATLEPVPQSGEIDFILDTANRYLERPATRADIRSAFAGIRPLVRSAGVERTASLSREHVIHIDPRSGLVTIAGGKWTTYRRMAEDLVDQAALLAGLPAVPCPTRTMPLHGAAARVDPNDPLSVYGNDAPAVAALALEEPALGRPLHAGLPVLKAQIAWAARQEMARTVDDALARRTRCLLFDAAAAIRAAPAAASILARELGRDPAWEREQVEAFRTVAEGYLVREQR